MAKPIKVAIIGDATKFNKSMDSASGKLAGFAAGTAAVAAAAVAAMGAAAIQIGGQFDSAYDGIRVGTGATGESLEALKDIMNDVATSVPTSLGDAGLAVADINTKMDLTGESLEKMAENQINLARLTGGDLATQITATARIFGDWGIESEDQVDRLNDLYQVAQTTGIGVDRLSTVVTNFGAPMRELGFGFDEATALIGKFEKEGVNTEAVMSGLKIGLGKMAQAGEDPIDTFKRVTESIKNAGSESEASELALAAFGQRAAVDMKKAIQEGRFEVDELMDSMSTDTIAAAAEDTESFGEKWTMFKNRVLVKLEPIIMKIFNGLGGLVEKLDPLFATLEWGVVALMAGFQTGEEGGEGFLGMMQTIGAKVAYWWPIIQQTISNTMTIIKWIIETVIGKVQELWDEHGEQIMSTVQSFMDAVQAIIYTIVGVIMDIWEDHGEAILDTLQGIWDSLQDVISGALDIIQGIFETFSALFKGDWGGMWDGIKQVFAGVWNALGGIVSAALDIVILVVMVAVQKVKDVLLGIGTAIGDTARDIWDKAWDLGANLMNGIKDGVVGAVGAVGDMGKAVANSIIGFINKELIDRINNIQIEIPNPFGKNPTLGLPRKLDRIPTIRAMGGPADGMTLVGERGPEMVSLPRGSRVTPNHEASAGGGVTVNVRTDADPFEIARDIVWAMKTSGR